MHPRIQELVHHLESSRAALDRAVERVPEALRERPPGPRRWSVAEVLEHLTVVDRRVGDLLEQYLAAARTGGGLPAETRTDSVLEGFAAELLLDRSRPLVATQATLPRGGRSIAEIGQELEEARARLLEIVRSADGLAIGEVVHPHPVAGPLDLYQWIAFAGVHERRHAAQVEEIADALADQP